MTLAHVVDVQQFIWSQIARTIYTAIPLLLDFPKRRRAKRKVNILEMPSARFIGEQLVVVLVVRTSGTYCMRKKATRMYVLRDSLFLQDVLDLVDLIVAMGVLS